MEYYDGLMRMYILFTCPYILLQLNGRQTQGENIADNGGLQIAYQAYQTQKKTTQPQKIGNIEGFTETQLFFLAFGQAWCGKATPEATQSRLLTDVHAPNRWRVNGIVMNSKEFANAFQCQRNSKMNPTTKCQLW